MESQHPTNRRNIPSQTASSSKIPGPRLRRFTCKGVKNHKYYLPLVLLLPLLLLLLRPSVVSDQPPASVTSDSIYPIAHLLNILSYLPYSPFSSSGSQISSAIVKHVQRNPSSLLARYRLLSPACPRQPYVPHLLEAIRLHRVRTNSPPAPSPNSTLLILVEPAVPFSSNGTSLTRAYLSEIVPIVERFQTINILPQPYLPDQAAQSLHDASHLLSFLSFLNIAANILPPVDTDEALLLAHSASNLLVHHGPFSALAALVTGGIVHHSYLFDPYLAGDEFRWQIRSLAVNPHPPSRMLEPMFASMGPVAHSCCQFEGFGYGDGEKIICTNARQFASERCWVVSLGCRGDWSFEHDIVQRTNCDVHTFDCSGEWPVPEQLRSRVTFHKLCIGESGDAREDFASWNELMRFGSGTPAMLKMDIEGFEYPVLGEMLAGAEELLPEQMAVEIHMRSETGGLFQNLSRSGFEFVHRADNPYCDYCSEVTLVKRDALPAPFLERTSF